MLSASGISLVEAYKRGIRYIDNVTLPKHKLPVLGGGFSTKGIPASSSYGLVFPHFSLDGRRSLQFRPFVPYVTKFMKADDKARKYDWERDAGNGLSIGYNAALRLADGTAHRLVIVEGTKQAIAADIYAPADVAVVGIAGIWNGQFTNEDGERELLGDLAKLAGQFSDITVVPDGDVKTKPHVWDGASLLCELLYDAACADLTEEMGGADLDTSVRLMRQATERAPKVAALPTAEGIDDILGRTEETERVALMASLLDNADELPERPYDAEGDEAARESREESRWDRLNAHLDASAFVELVYGGGLGGETIELPEGTLTVGRFNRGDGPEFVKTADAAVAARLGIQVGKCATSASLLIGAVGGKAAWNVLGKFDGMPAALVEWLDENADRLKAAAAELSGRKPKPDALRRILVATGGDIDKALTLIKEAQAKETNK
ncbi:DUF3854 domain-containing protein [Microbacterium sp. MRS-1]|uniref:DUF3854 domain-containing protein n=1 Tax=Microbacterium sp. MRS-1 TaxID=1451261 RepID=UPI0004533D47|nr:DUF3854 domain-containing protein [Microbacterium sp. MRS-1]EXJ50743.1 hypothetical protein AS96_12945 [Microbacterium sp. MRS-1]